MKEKYNYFDEFIKDSNYIVEATKILDEILKNFNEKSLKENMEKIHNVENDADHLLHNMLNYLVKDFIPPFDREDIILIIRTLDDIIDFIDELIKNFYIYNITSIKKETLHFSNLLVESGNYINEMLNALKDYKNKSLVKEKIIAINEIESNGDILFENAMRDLYHDSEDPIEIVKWSNIYNCLENTLDACEHISDCVEDIIMKYL